MQKSQMSVVVSTMVIGLFSVIVCGAEPVALKGTDNPKRMKELCRGAPDGYNKRPFPCPKPVGELLLQLPPPQSSLFYNLRGPDVYLHSQRRLHIRVSHHQ